LCSLSIRKGDDRGPAWAGQLLAVAAGTGMRELVARSHWHRARLGEPGAAAEAARNLAREIGNPALDASLV
jgi:hypothetical protein